MPKVTDVVSREACPGHKGAPLPHLCSPADTPRPTRAPGHCVPALVAAATEGALAACVPPTSPSPWYTVGQTRLVQTQAAGDTVRPGCKPPSWFLMDNQSFPQTRVSELEGVAPSFPQSTLSTPSSPLFLPLCPLKPTLRTYFFGPSTEVNTGLRQGE